MEHPIDDIMKTTMDSLKNIVDVNTIVGTPIETKSGAVIIPISKVCFTFASGGSEFKGETIDEYTRREKEEEIQYRLPFGGGSGAGVSIKPVSFLVVNGDTIKLLPVDYDSTLDKLVDYIPEFMEKGNEAIKCMQEKNKSLKELKTKIEENIKNDLKNVSNKSSDNTEQNKEEEKLSKTSYGEMPE